MPTFSTRRRVAFSPDQMFALVADVEHYPLFLPLCEALVVRSREAGTDGASILLADMTVGYKAIRETFRTRVSLAPAERRIVAQYVDGPFRHLENRWSFSPAGGGTDVEFFISYELKSVLLGMLAGAVFDQAFRRYAEAFEARARRVYGAPAADPAPDVLPPGVGPQVGGSGHP